MKKDKKNKVNPQKIDKETLSQLDDEQLKQIAGGATYGNPDDTDEDEASCPLISHGCVSCLSPG